MQVLITGDAGFIGSPVVRHIIEETNDSVINVDKLACTGSLESLLSVRKNRCNRKSSDVAWHNALVTLQQRAELKQQKPVVLWFTGLSGSGKSTVANVAETQLLALSKHSDLLDGDNVRHGLNQDLGFSDKDRVENIRRIGEVAKLFVDSGSIVLTAFISPFISDRQ